MMAFVRTPFVLVQLSDPHLGAAWAGDGDTYALLAETVECVRARVPAPDAVLVSGDLADHATDAEYTRFRELLEPLGAPLYVLPGNHDDRAALRRHFALGGAPDDPIQADVDLGAVRLVVVDSTRPGEDAGELDAHRLAALDATLEASPDRPTLIAMHHPPLATGFPAWDRMLFTASDLRALGVVVAAHPQVRLIVAGHVHRALAGTLAGRPVRAAPSTYVQAELGPGPKVALTRERPGYVLHAVADGEIVSSVHAVP
jgi:3',5'-cyclic AMP phosphodiesterase CpdA